MTVSMPSGALKVAETTCDEACHALVSTLIECGYTSKQINAAFAKLGYLRASPSPATGALSEPVTDLYAAIMSIPVTRCLVGTVGDAYQAGHTYARCEAARLARAALSPAKREAKPLTDERLREAFMQTNTRSYDATYACFRDGVHFAELHHGITSASQVESEDKL